MRHIKNIEISEKHNRNMQQAESGFKYWIVLFVFIAWLCRSEIPQAEPVLLQRVAYHPSGDMPVSSLKILGWEIF